MTSATSKFEYKPLETPTSIRLLEINESKGPAIICSLSHVVLNDHPSYEALSYTWSDSRPPPERGQAHDFQWDALVGHGSQRLICNGQVIPTSLDLRQALFVFHRVSKRQKYHRARIWVDAICIDQHDAAERSAQVTIMGDIYKGAKRVFAWLGPSPMYAPMSLSILHSIANISEEHRRTLRFGGLVALGLSPPKLLLFVAFLKRTWFSRVWVIQEVLLARDIIIMWGCIEVSLEMLNKAMDIIMEDHLWGSMAYLDMMYSPAEEMGTKRGTRALGSVMVVMEPAKKKTIMYDSNYPLSLTTIGRTCGATDVRDHVYGILGIVKEILKTSTKSAWKERGFLGLGGMVPDYSKPVYDVYYDYGRLFVMNKGTFILLGMIEDRSRRSPALAGKLPSWVPDFSVAEMPAALIMCNPDAHWNASGPCDPSAFDPIDEPGGTLHLRGFQIDAIVAKATYKKCDLYLFKSLLQLLLDVATYGKVAPLATHFDALSRSLIVDVHHGTHERLNLRSSFKDWIFTKFLDLYSAREGALDQIAENGFSGELGQLCSPQASVRLCSHAAFEGRPSIEEHAEVFRSAQGVLQSLYEMDPSLLPSASSLESRISSLDKTDPDVKTSLGHADLYGMLSDVVLNSRSAVRTSLNRIGVVHKSAQVGDQVWLCRGAKVPYILRPLEADAEYEFMGEAYVDGIMEGQAVPVPAIWQDFRLK